MALDNFVLQNTNPLEAYLQGAGGIQTLQNNQQVMQLRQQQMEQAQAAQQLAQQQAEAAQAAAIAKQQAQVDMYNTDNPYERAKKIALYTVQYPEEVAGIKQATQGMSDAQRTSLLGFAGKITSATDNGRLDLGKQEFTNQIAAMKTGGAPPEQIAAIESYQHMYDYDPKGAILGLGVAANAIDPATYEANIKVAAETQAIKGKESREVELQPLEVEAKKATTEKIREETRSELQKRGLTSAQIAKTQVEAEKQLQELGQEGGGKPPTELQAKANLFGTRAMKANTNLTMLELDPANIPHLPDSVMMAASAVGGLSPKEQSYMQSKRDFINAVLRKESGAAIGKDEYESADIQYFPKLGDAPSTIAQKATNRKDAASLILAEAGSFAGKGATPSGAKTATKASIIASAKAHGVNPLEAMKQWTEQGNILK